MRRSIASAGAVLAVASLLFACKDDGVTPLVPEILALVSGGGQDGTVGQQLSQPVVVRVAGSGDQPVAGVTVSFSAAGGGSFSPASAQTDANGQASSHWTLGPTAGAQSGQATVASLTPLTVTANAGPDAAATVEVTPADVTLEAIGATATATASAEDQFGNAIPAAFTWVSRNEAVATVSTAGVITAESQGTTFVVATAGTGADSVQVTVDQVPVSLAVSPSADTIAFEQTVQLSAELRDANGHAIPGATFTWASEDADIATVSAAGLATGTGLGIANVHASSGGLADTAAIRVTPDPAMSLARGLAHNCVLDGDGNAWCWGDNASGNLGDNTTEYRSVPVPVSGGHKFVRIASGIYYHTCAQAADYTLYCWGLNNAGQLGDNTTTPRHVPTEVSTTQTFRSFSVGFLHTCARTNAGQVYCWGDNTYGQLGDGTQTQRHVPTAVTGAFNFAQIALGGFVSCGIESGGAASCWGYNGEGQVGDGTTADFRLTPVSVSGGHSFASISGGLLHTCGTSTAGVSYCWGFNFYGQLGIGNEEDVNVPTAVSGGGVYTSLGPGYLTTCGVRDGAAYCWGYGALGQLGDGTIASRNTPSPVGGGLTFREAGSGFYNSCGIAASGAPYCWGYFLFLGDGSLGYEPTAVAVSGSVNWARVSAGNGHTCGVSTADTPYCWGNNASGELGLGHTNPAVSPEEIDGFSFTRVTAGQNHSCGLTAGGNAYCWGANNHGQLGDGTNDPSEVPVAVNAAFTFSAITAGNNHTCAIRASNSVAYCWGLNSAGQLGDASFTARNSPVVVSGGHTFGSISAGAVHTCGIAGTGVTYCWGNGGNGRLGNNGTANSNTPEVVSGGLGFASVSGGGAHTCGVTTGNLAYCWGLNSQGRLGDGTTTQRLVPTAVTGGVSFASISAGGTFTCAVGTNNAGYCWGNNAAGQLGNGSTTQQSTPTPMQGGHAFAAISSGQTHSCGVTGAGAAYCWGDKGFGQLGTGTGVLALSPVLVSGGLNVATIPGLSAQTSLPQLFGRTLGEPVSRPNRELKVKAQLPKLQP